MGLRFKTLRLIELALLVIFVGCVISAAYIWVQDTLPPNQKWGVVGIAGIVLTMKLALQSIVDQRISALELSSDVTTDVAYTTLYERSPVAYVTIDTQGAIVAFNTAAVHLLQVSRDLMLTKNLYTVIIDSEESQASATVLRQKISAGVTIKDQEVQLYNGLGQTIWVSMSVFEGARPGERMIALLDITEKKLVDTAKSEFLALATHQLRTPIAAIRWNVELLEKKLTDTILPAQKNNLDKIKRNVIRMIALINDFLNVSKLEMGTFAATAEQLQLEQFMTGIADEFHEKVTQKQLLFSFNITPPAIVVKTDPRLFHIIISNLASNAVKYTPAGGAVMVNMYLQDSLLVVEVSDSGIGVPETEVPKLFSKFFRASNATAQQTEGTGLGLYVVKQSVEQLGGTIQVETSESTGTRFVVQIPVQVVFVGEVE